MTKLNLKVQRPATWLGYNLVKVTRLPASENPTYWQVHQNRKAGQA